MRVLICGSRTFADRNAIYTVLDGLLAEAGTHLDMDVMHGGARGADSTADDWAAFHGVARRLFTPNWDGHGKAAGPIRNQQMLDVGKPDVVWAFIDKPLPESRGTADMVDRARKAAVPVYVVSVG